MRLAVILGIALFGAAARAGTITVTPSDSFDKIENAQPGDEVVIAPGTYRFRLMLTKQAPASTPIIIRAQDPQNPPVWDMGTTLVEDAPGSATAGDRGRGCWQVVGGTNYVIDTIVFTHCRTASHNSAGIRYWNNVHGLIVRNCVFRENDNGITGGNANSDAIVEFSEFDRNGNLAATNGPTHNLYIYGGTFTLRYSYVHDPVQAQNFHIRAQNGTLANNWFARGKSYEGDLMTDDDFTGGESQSLLLVGNVLVQNQAPDNNGQIVAVYNDNGIANITMSVRLVNNTLVGNGGNAAFVHLSNADGTMMHAEISNNIIFGTTRANLVETSAAATVSGTNNWMATGANVGGLSGTIFSTAPGFKDAANKDFTLAQGSMAIGRADAQVMGLPAAEYYRDETMTRMYRTRASAHDLGAFESTTTGPGIGPGGGAGGAGGAGGSGGAGAGGGTGGSGGLQSGGTGGGPQGNAESGCGCIVGSAAVPIGGLLLIVIALVMTRFRRSG